MPDGPQEALLQNLQTQSANLAARQTRLENMRENLANPTPSQEQGDLHNISNPVERMKVVIGNGTKRKEDNVMAKKRERIEALSARVKERKQRFDNAVEATSLLPQAEELYKEGNLTDDEYLEILMAHEATLDALGIKVNDTENGVQQPEVQKPNAPVTEGDYLVAGYIDSIADKLGQNNFETPVGVFEALSSAVSPDVAQKIRDLPDQEKIDLRIQAMQNLKNLFADKKAVDQFIAGLDSQDPKRKFLEYFQRNADKRTPDGKGIVEFLEDLVKTKTSIAPIEHHGTVTGVVKTIQKEGEAPVTEKVLTSV